MDSVEQPIIEVSVVFGVCTRGAWVVDDWCTWSAHPLTLSHVT